MDGAPAGDVTHGVRMSLLLKRWRHWMSPAARRGRRVVQGDYQAWAASQRQRHSRAAADATKR
jgi:hypothetical protein